MSTTFFHWDPQLYSIEVDAMDREHQKLIDIMNRLYARHGEGAPREELNALVDELGAYTALHFEHEEAYMESIGFPGLGPHKLIHVGLLEKYSQHVEDFRATGELSDDFYGFLRRWLQAHIRGIDQKYGDFVKLPKSA